MIPRTLSPLVKRTSPRAGSFPIPSGSEAHSTVLLKGEVLKLLRTGAPITIDQIADATEAAVYGMVDERTLDGVSEGFGNLL
jgi:hypothetical protein